MAKKVDLRAIRKTDLGEFEGKRVVGARIEVRNTGNGLEKSQTVDPVKLDQGDRVVVCFECDIDKIRHDPFDKDELDGDQLRVHLALAEKAVILPRGTAFEEVTKLLDEQEARYNAAVESVAGQEQIPGTESPDGEKPAAQKSTKTRGTRRTRKSTKATH